MGQVEVEMVFMDVNSGVNAAKHALKFLNKQRKVQLQPLVILQFIDGQVQIQV